MPRSPFAADDTMLHCSDKSKLTDILELHLLIYRITPHDIPQPNKRVAISDAMADVQSMDKPGWIKKCKDMSAHVLTFIQRNYDEFDKLHTLFYRYGIAKSLKK